jgi:hypothetical protein
MPKLPSNPRKTKYHGDVVGWLNEPDLNQTCASMMSNGLEAGDRVPGAEASIDVYAAHAYSAEAQTPLRNETFSVSARLWGFAHLARFVRTGAVRVEVNDGDVGFLGTSAFVNGDDGSLVVQAISNGHVDIEAQLSIQGWDR